MSISYTNRITGRTVVMDEPNELGHKLTSAIHRGRKLSNTKINRRVRYRARTLTKMDASWKWARTDQLAEDQVADEQAETADGDLSQLRKPELKALAEKHGLDPEGTVAELRDRLADYV